MNYSNFKIELPRNDFQQIAEKLKTNNRMERMASKGESQFYKWTFGKANRVNDRKIEYRLDYRLQFRVPVTVPTFVVVEEHDAIIQVKCFSKVSKLILLIGIPFLLATFLVTLLNSQVNIGPYIYLIVSFIAVLFLALRQLKKKVTSIVKEIIE